MTLTEAGAARFAGDGHRVGRGGRRRARGAAGRGRGRPGDAEPQGGDRAAGTLTLRDLEPGDLGWLVQRHGELYAREFGYDQTFERLVAQIAADFDPDTDRAWVAEIGGTKVGAILCVHTDDTTAKLRTLLVEPKARGRGVGGTLIDQVIRHARTHGYTTLTLYTNDNLHPARRLYEARRLHAPPKASPERAYGHRAHRRADVVPYAEAMNRDELRGAQAPLKTRYKDDPASADHPQGRGHVGDGVQCDVETGRAIAQAGLTRSPAATAACCARATCCSRRWSPAPA